MYSEQVSTVAGLRHLQPGSWLSSRNPLGLSHLDRHSTVFWRTKASSCRVTTLDVSERRCVRPQDTDKQGLPQGQVTLSCRTGLGHQHHVAMNRRPEAWTDRMPRFVRLTSLSTEHAGNERLTKRPWLMVTYILRPIRGSCAEKLS